MRASGLKLQITFTLFVLMAIAIVLGNLVVFMFWQRAMVRSEVEHVTAVLDNASIFRLNLSQVSRRAIEDDLETVCRSMGSRCIDSLYFDGVRLAENSLDDLAPQLKDAARTVAASGERVVKLDGSIWRVMFSARRQHLFVAEPLIASDGVERAAVLVLELDSIYELIKEDQKIILVYLLVNLLLLSVVGLFRMIKLIVRPIDRIVEMTDSYGATDSLFFSTRGDSTEFSLLNRALNNMLARIEGDKEKLRETINLLEAANEELRTAHREMVRTEKLASVGRLSAGLAHEIGNPIGIVQGYIDLLRQDSLSPDQRQQFSSRAVSELERISGLIHQLLDYAGTSSAGFERIEIDENFVGTVIDLVNLRNKSDTVTMDMNLAPQLAVQGTREGLQQVLLNCVLNALDAMEECGSGRNGRIILRGKKINDADDGGQPVIEISIVDNGIGIEPAAGDTLFDPFYTTKEPGRGTGLGLFVSHAIVEAHGGKITVTNNEDEGVTVRITLPAIL